MQHESYPERQARDDAHLHRTHVLALCPRPQSASSCSSRRRSLPRPWPSPSSPRPPPLPPSSPRPRPPPRMQAWATTRVRPRRQQRRLQGGGESPRACRSGATLRRPRRAEPRAQRPLCAVIAGRGAPRGATAPPGLLRERGQGGASGTCREDGRGAVRAGTEARVVERGDEQESGCRAHGGVAVTMLGEGKKE
ncbi:hypothetical protein PVAP13_5KG306200 [Panicum virgatum]|uniref:Uncharacterized protein n=1 Tax=Panicum virgatum TaxID=38727 RepID=A0A8T0SLG0_PANVG|nr:hypothetical protein PVAP13_5KG306200 [Panicum virgatum]